MKFCWSGNCAELRTWHVVEPNKYLSFRLINVVFPNFPNRLLRLNNTSSSSALQARTRVDGKMQKPRATKQPQSHMRARRKAFNVKLFSFFYLKVGPVPGFPLEPGGPRFPFWPGMSAPGNPGGPGSPTTPVGPCGPMSPTVPFLPGRPGRPGAPLSPLAPREKKMWW